MTASITDKDGTTVIGVKVLHTSPWHVVAEGQGDSGQPVAIKSFRPPDSLCDDPSRAEQIARERNRLLIAARLQKELSDSGATGWVETRKICEDAENPYAIMEKCSGSVEGLIEHRIRPDSSLLYSIASGVLTGLEELWQRRQRSHENLKPSNVFVSLVAGDRRYRLADPAAEGKKDSSANDLFALGSILFRLVEHKEFDAINGRIYGSPNWDRLGGKSSRWIAFCEYLLNPAGCQAPLPQVRERLSHLRPAARFQRSLVAASFVVAAVLVVAFVAPRVLHRRGPILPLAVNSAALSSSPPATMHSTSAPVVNGTPMVPAPAQDSPRVLDAPVSLPSPPRLTSARDPLAAALVALRQNDYETAAPLLRQSAESGNPEAMLRFGELFENGQGVTQDSAEAMKLYRKAADLGLTKAMIRIGLIYEVGLVDVKGDYAEAMKWYRMAADSSQMGPDRANGMMRVGYLYESGKGVPQDNTEAIRWYRKAADFGDSLAKGALGRLGVDK